MSAGRPTGDDLRLSNELDRALESGQTVLAPMTPNPDITVILTELDVDIDRP